MSDSKKHIDLLSAIDIAGHMVNLPYSPMSRFVKETDPSDPKTIYIRTSERLLFRRCRRLWAWTSPLKLYREIITRPDYFWFGTGMHYALEDYHGVNYYGHPAAAFIAYCRATQEAKLAPGDLRELEKLGVGMMVYYKDHWLDKAGRDPLQTYMVDGKPQCEVRFQIPLPITGPNGEKVVYRGQIDRMSIDEYGLVWVVEYKSAKSFRTQHFDTDDQCTAYCWAAQAIYGIPIAGVIYQQHKKAVPTRPKLLSTGKVSTSKTLSTTHALYASALIEHYGDIKIAPKECQAYLRALIDADEDDTKDKFIQRDIVQRNQYQIAAQGEKILLEVEDMLREDLPLYPNPNKDCSWQCPLEAVCLAIDDGSEWDSLFLSLTRKREEESDEWRIHLPQQVPEIPAELLQLVPQMELPEQSLEQQNKWRDLDQQLESEFLDLLGPGL